MKRRHFIYLAGMLPVALGISALPVIASDTPRSYEAADTDAAIAHIFYLASLAPSSHNTQPWCLFRQASPLDWQLRLDKERCLPAVDPSNHEMLLSLGAFLENMRLSAPIYGYEAQYALQPSEKLPIDIHFQKTNKAPIAKIDTIIQKRRTLRKDLQTIPLTPAEQTHILGSSDTLHFFPHGSAIAEQLAALTRSANQKQSQRLDIQQELSHWIRWKHSQQVQHADGLTPATMEMGFPLKWLAQYFFSPEDLLTPRFQQSSLALIETQIHEGAGWLIVQSPSTQPRDLLHTGQCLEALWLRAASQEIALHPMLQAVEDSTCRQQLQELFPGKTISFLARLGHPPAYPAPVSYRRPLGKIIAKEPSP